MGWENNISRYSQDRGSCRIEGLQEDPDPVPIGPYLIIRSDYDPCGIDPGQQCYEKEKWGNHMRVNNVRRYVIQPEKHPGYAGKNSSHVSIQDQFLKQA